MGVGCWLRTTIHYRGNSFRTKDEVFDKIELNDKIIANCEKDLMTYMTMTEPAKFWRESEAEVGETPYIWLMNQVQTAIDSIKECSEENAKLKILLFDWDECHNADGMAIEAPKTDSKGTYYGGDYIDTVYPDGTPAYNHRKSILGIEYPEACPLVGNPNVRPFE